MGLSYFVEACRHAVQCATDETVYSGLLPEIYLTMTLKHSIRGKIKKLLYKTYIEDCKRIIGYESEEGKTLVETF